MRSTRNRWSAPGYPGQIHGFSQLDIAFRAEDDEPVVAPRRETARGEPVDANITRRALGSQQDLSEVLKLGSVEVGAVGNRRRDDLGVERAR